MTSDYRKVVCLDLDHTLFNNQDVLKKALNSALNNLDIGLSKEEIWDAVDKLSSLSLILTHLGFPNFKHFWNADEFYILLTIFFSKNNNHKEIFYKFNIDRNELLSYLYQQQNFIKSIKNDFYKYFSIDKHINKIIQSINITRLHQVVRYFKDTYNEFITLKNIFNDNFNIQPLDNVIDFLKYLQDEHIETILVSEGIDNIQIKKLSKMNILPFFKHRILTTEKAANPNGIKELDNAWNNIVKKNINELLESDKCIIFFRNMIRDMELKDNENFYRRILHVIKSNEINLENALSELKYIKFKEWNLLPPVKLVMIGDRYDKDVLPLINILSQNNIKTIRLRLGKYKDEYPDDSIQVNLRPTKTLTNFEDIKDYFLKDHFWEDLNFIDYVRPISKKEAMIIKEKLRNISTPDFEIIKLIIEQYNDTE